MINKERSEALKILSVVLSERDYHSLLVTGTVLGTLTFISSSPHLHLTFTSLLLDFTLPYISVNLVPIFIFTLSRTMICL